MNDHPPKRRQNSAYRFALFFMKSTIYAKILLLFISLVIILITAEAVCRKTENFLYLNTRPYIQQAKPAIHRVSAIHGLGYEMVPGGESEEGFFQINSKGLRDREFLIPKPSATYRIIILGDSVTFGTEYPVEETYAKLLERRLQEFPLCSGVNYEVINAGVCGYNALQKFHLFRNLREYDPDLVIFQFLNDDYYRSAVVLPEPGRPENLSVGEYFSLNFPSVMPLPGKVDRLLLNYSAFYRRISIFLYDALSRWSPATYPPEAYRYPGFDTLADSMERNQEVFSRFSMLARGDGFRFLLLLQPYLKSEFRVDPWISEYCPKKYGFSCIDVYAAFQSDKVDPHSLRATPEGDCHLNRWGHVYLAELIYRWLQENITH